MMDKASSHIRRPQDIKLVCFDPCLAIESRSFLVCATVLIESFHAEIRLFREVHGHSELKVCVTLIQTHEYHSIYLRHLQLILILHFCSDQPSVKPCWNT